MVVRLAARCVVGEGVAAAGATPQSGPAECVMRLVMARLRMAALCMAMAVIVAVPMPRHALRHGCKATENANAADGGMQGTLETTAYELR